MARINQQGDGGTMFGTVYHVGYLTDDAEKATEYCARMFAGEATARVRGADGGQIVYFRAGETELELIQPADPARLAGRTGLILDHIGYFVDDIEQSIAGLKARGMRFQTEEPTVSAVGYKMIFLDQSLTLGTRMHLTEKKRG